MQREMEMEADQPQRACIKGAESVLNLPPKSSVYIAYHSLFGPHDDLILLEMDDKLLPDILNQRVTIRGEHNEEAVLCTQSKTYAVKFVGTSNTVLLIPPSDQLAIYGSTEHYNEKDHDSTTVAPVIKVAIGSMELVEVAPKLDKLKLLLSENLYGYDEVSEMECDGGGKNTYRWDDLIENVQASDAELRSGLQALSAVEMDGYWRIVDEKYMDGVLNMLFHNSVLNDWSLNALNENEVVGVLESDGFSRRIAQHCLQVYGSKVDERQWRLDEKRVCVHIARGILRTGKMKMDNFMAEWMRKIPEGMQASFDMLEGEVLTEKLGIETWIHLFSVSSLPSTPAACFSMLFQERPKWEWKDLQPYIRDLSVPGLSSEGLLLKYTRRSQPTPDSEPVFSAR
ncbi:uncharacterized protein LOC127801272 [Diospyros lotus]|uniref:uncharacterized protein LOC127801272 n=1 Tax=Diospyros lotus TaxID=55363 RepID=UPI00225AEDD1|nr:uncharacterized protein LOC127801272 [Diospyros lotus]